MQLSKRVFTKVSSALHFTRLARLFGAKKVSFKQELFSDHYTDRHIKYDELADRHYVVSAHEATLFGPNGGLPNFILDWLKEAYLRLNRAYLRFLAIFDNTFVHQSLQLKSYSSVVLRAEKAQTAYEALTLKRSYFYSLTAQYDELAMLPATLVVRSEHYCLNNLVLLLKHYFPNDVSVSLTALEEKQIPDQARSRVGRCQLGQGAVLGRKFPQLGRKIIVSVKFESAICFAKLERQDSELMGRLRAIKTLCNYYVNHEVAVDVEAEYTGSQVESLYLTKQQSQAIVLGVNSNLATRGGIFKRIVRAR
ncbi:type VI secretion system baseplate subunit TssG [Pseudoalteromonas sp. MMG013]|uniref:type VI secretion system baseplate subunit TssG n=1 Tax=Pseudoalteromonas sp. MMG013 TaxID=2822687 RepID=UPI001B366662|nr:type VI secretion system baseplate subunit TssG [Pseudoalteromonas sp. MMG013]MBQ4861257.1 type VI secretion system baseplate subunit TssG [Pseudoalteromonas sp. MMG013]